MTADCNQLTKYQFAGQEPGSDEEVATFCQLNHGVTFPVRSKPIL